MEITSIKVERVQPKEKGICGEFSVVFDEVLCIHKVHVINGEKGLFIGFPNTGEMRIYKGQQRYFDIVHPITGDFRQYVEETILNKYNSIVADINEE